MLTMTQSATLLSEVFEVPEGPVQAVRKRLIANGSLPGSVGRNIPAAFPHRVALMIIGLGIPNADRVCALADLRRFQTMPGDVADAPTLADVLTGCVKGLIEQPDVGLDMHLVLTTDNVPWATFLSRGQVTMQFGEPRPQAGFVQATTSISMMPLSLYADKARAVTPPYPVSR